MNVTEGYVLSVHNNTDKWIERNKEFFCPPVCNKMMHNEGQLKVFYVGGPNQRKDYHIEEGEELFYMLKGDMVLKVIEQGIHKDVHIGEGQIFLLPGCIPHSPQRKKDTIGMVIERRRKKSEIDGLRYYVEKDNKPIMDILYEEWFHCTDLGTQLAPIIKKFFDSEQYKTGRPLPGFFPSCPPVVVDTELVLKQPFNIRHWVDANRMQLNEEGSLSVFEEHSQFQVIVFGKGESTGRYNDVDLFIWQLEGTSDVLVQATNFDLRENDTLLILAGQEYTTKRPMGSVSLLIVQDPSRVLQKASFQ